MKKQIKGLEKLSAYLSALFLLFTSCNDMDSPQRDTLDYTFRQIRFTSHSKVDANLTNINCYLFRSGILYKRYHNLAISGDGRLGFNVPAHSELYFLANITEPSQLAEMKEGDTTREEFLSYHTSVTEEHSPTRAPSEFYSTKVNPDITDSSFDVSLGLSLSRIDIDASAASGIKIERIYTRNAAGTTSYFPSDNLSHATETHTYSFTFRQPESGKVEDVFRIYESATPVTFIIEGIYGDAPVTVSTIIKQIKRNKIYNIRIQSDGMNVVSNILIDDWKNGSEVTASENEGTAIRIDTEHSVLPANTTLDTSKTVANIVSLDITTKIKLAFLTNEALQLESVEGLPQAIGLPETSILNKKHLTSYEITLTPNSSLLTSCVTLNFKTISGEQNIYGKITLNNHPSSHTNGKTTNCPSPDK